MARDDYGRGGRGRHGRWDAQRDASNESGREAGYGRPPRSGYGGDRDYPGQGGYASADMSRSGRGDRPGGRDIEYDEEYDALPDEGYTRAMGNPDSEWGAGAAGGYGRSGDYGHRGGTGRWGGAPSGRAPDESDLADRERYDRGFRAGSSFYGGYGDSSGYRNAGERDHGARAYDDRQFRPNHTGRGPKNYRRSDVRITEDINEALTRHRDIDASEIEVRCEAGVVTLTGTVDSKQAKRLAEDLAEEVSGVRDVNNELRVERGGSNRSRDEARVATDREVTRTTARETGSSGSAASATSEGKAARGRARTPESRK